MDTGCRLEDLPGAMDDRDGWKDIEFEKSVQGEWVDDDDDDDDDDILTLLNTNYISKYLHGSSDETRKDNWQLGRIMQSLSRHKEIEYMFLCCWGRE